MISTKKSAEQLASERAMSVLGVAGGNGMAAAPPDDDE